MLYRILEKLAYELKTKQGSKGFIEFYDGNNLFMCLGQPRWATQKPNRLYIWKQKTERVYALLPL